MITNLFHYPPSLVWRLLQEGLPWPDFVSSSDYDSGILVVRWENRFVTHSTFYDIEGDRFNQMWEKRTAIGLYDVSQYSAMDYLRCIYTSDTDHR